MQAKVLKKRIDAYLKEEETNNKKLFEKLSLYIFQIETPKSDLHILANILSPKEIAEIVNYYDGDSLKLPTKQEYQDCLFIATCFYLKEVKGMNWAEIKRFIDLPEQEKELLNTIKIGRKINQIKEKMSKYFVNIVQAIDWDIQEVKDFLDEKVK